MGLETRSGFVTLERLEQEVRIILKRINAGGSGGGGIEADDGLFDFDGNDDLQPIVATNVLDMLFGLDGNNDIQPDEADFELDSLGNIQPAGAGRTPTFLTPDDGSREPTGFMDKSDVSLSFDNATRRLTVAPISYKFEFWYQGVRFTKREAETIDLPAPDAEGVHLIYYDADGVLQQVANPSHSQTKTAIENYCLVAYVYFDEDNNVGQLAIELHGMVMDNITHLYLHEAIGAVFDSGFALGDFVISDGSDNEDAQFSVATGELFDEDIELEPNAIVKTVGCEIWYRDGSDWRWTTNAGFSVYNTVLCVVISLLLILVRMVR